MVVFHWLQKGVMVIINVSAIFWNGWYTKILLLAPSTSILPSTSICHFFAFPLLSFKRQKVASSLLNPLLLTDVFFFLYYSLHCPKCALIFYLTEGHFRRVTHASPIVYGWGLWPLFFSVRPIWWALQKCKKKKNSVYWSMGFKWLFFRF